MKAALRTIVLVAFAAAVATALLPYWSAGAMILRAAKADGALGRIARWEARTVSTSIEQISTRDGLTRIRLFRPSGSARRAILLVSGVHPDGIDEPRLVQLARDLAGTGVNVVTPEIRDLVAFRLTAAVTDAIEDTARWLADNQELSGDTPIGMIGVSFSGGLSIVAAGRPALRNRVAYVLSFGGHGNLPRVLKYLCTGEPGALRATRPPHDYAVAVVLHQAAELIVPPDQVDPLRQGVEMFLRASAQARAGAAQEKNTFDAAIALQQRMVEPAATLMKYVNERHVAALGNRLLPYLDRLGQDPALSPDLSSPPSAPVYLLHGHDDNVIPAAESELLAARLAGSTKVRFLKSGFLSHVDVDTRPTPGDAWRMLAFWKAALAEQSRGWGLGIRD